MKALLKREGKPGLWLEDVPEPQIGINDVLIRVRKTGICGTDLHIYRWDDWAQKTIPVPMVVGHEFVGEIVKAGSNVSDFHPGDVVSGEGHVVCGRCRNCLAGRRHLCAHTQGIGVNRPGAFAEYIALLMTNIWRHHPSIDYEVASIFDPFGNAVHTALSFPVLGEDVLITGAGPTGIIAAAVVKHAGARFVVITDVNPWRLELARKVGVTMAVNIRSDLCASAPEGIRYGLVTGRVVMTDYGDWDLRPALRQLRAPLLVVHGEAEAIPMDLVEEWVTAVPGARLLRVPGAAHFAYAEQPDLVWPEVEPFLGGLPGS